MKLTRSLVRSGPPLLIIHGTADTRVPFAEAMRLYTMARSAGLPVRFHPVAGVGHDWAVRMRWGRRLDTGELLIDSADRFLRGAFAKSLKPVGECVASGSDCPN